MKIHKSMRKSNLYTQKNHGSYVHTLQEVKICTGETPAHHRSPGNKKQLTKHSVMCTWGNNYCNSDVQKKA